MKINALKKSLALILAAVFLLAASACGSQSDSGNDDSLKKVLESGKLVLGLDVGFPPMGFLDESGEIVGFDIDVAREVCKRLGVELVPKGIDWSKKEEDLNNGVIDCIWNGFSVTPQREEALTLSEPYMKNEIIVVVTGDSSVKTLRDLEGLKVGAQAGSTAEDILNKSQVAPNLTVSSYETVMVLLDSLDKNEIDAAIVDSVAAYYYIFSKDNRYFTLPDSLDEEEYAIGFRKGDNALRDKVQETVIAMKTDGTLGEISKKWFGSDITIVR